MKAQHMLLPGDEAMRSFKFQMGKTKIVVNRPDLDEKEKELRLKELYKAIAGCLKK